MTFTVNIPILPKDLRPGVESAYEAAKKQNSKNDLSGDSIKQKNHTGVTANILPQLNVNGETLSDKKSPFTGEYYHDRLQISTANQNYEFPDDPFVRPVLNKRIVETELINGDQVIDTVTEIIGDGRYSLTITGELQGLNGLYPQSELQQLSRVCKLNVSWQCTSRLLQDLGITNFVIHSLEIEQPTGLPDTVYYTIQAKEDKPAELIVGELGF